MKEDCDIFMIYELHISLFLWKKYFYEKRKLIHFPYELFYPLENLLSPKYIWGYSKLQQQKSTTPPPPSQVHIVFSLSFIISSTMEPKKYSNADRHMFTQYIFIQN